MSEFLDKHTLFDNNTIRVIEPFVLYSYVDDDNVVVWDEDISDNEDWSMVNKKIELYARTCYKSEDRITVESADKFVKHLHSRHHDGALEHVTVTVKLFCSRAASHQIVRHRLASYLQESQRYCNYGKDDKLVVVAPEELYTNRNFEALNEYVSDMAIEYGIYKKWLAKGWNTEDSRYFLPNGTKAELVMTANLRQWVHIFNMRVDNKAVQWESRLVLGLIKNDFKKVMPVIFET